MKFYHFILLLPFFLSACIPQMQLVTLSSDTDFTESTNLEFDDSLVQISYNFYTPNGKIKFKIYNKSDKPIFVDWKNSMFIDATNVTKPYWTDKAIVETNSKNSDIALTSWMTIGSATTTGSVQKPDRITFIPPNTFVVVSKYLLSDGKMFPLNGECSVVNEDANWSKKSKTEEVQHCVFSKDNTPLKFRNYLTISQTEDFKTPLYYDFYFWIKEIWQMSAKQLVGDSFYDTNMPYIGMESGYHPYKKANRFFIK